MRKKLELTFKTCAERCLPKEGTAELEPRILNSKVINEHKKKVERNKQNHAYP
jgi:hypothetical protein